MIQYYMLTDPIRAGEIIRQDGRRHFRFSFGPFRWDRTTVLQAYLTEGTPLTGCYRLLEEEEAQKLLMEQGRHISMQLKKAEDMARKAHAQQISRDGKPYLDHIQAVADSLEDWEEKTAAWLHEICNYGGWTVEQLRKAGFSRRICRCVELLTLADGESIRAYLTRIRNDRIARRVKIADLAGCIETSDYKNLTDIQQRYVDKCREARQYLFGDIREFGGDFDLEAGHRPQMRMPSAAEIFQKIYPLALGGRKVPHGVSNPVLRRRDGQLYLAFFVYTYTKAQLQQGAIGRPVSWILADLSTGALIREIPCSQEDFSTAGRDERFSTTPSGKPAEGDSFEQIYGVLDEVRSKYRSDGVVDQQLYAAYLDRMLQAVPASYHRFYRELSNP